MLKHLGAFLALTALLAVPAYAVEQKVTGGIVKGDMLPDGGTVFRSIPFAQPPVGDLRWKPPMPVVPWSGVRDTTRMASPCAQRSFGWNAADAYDGQEDCLYVAVQSPPHQTGTRLPVMVWIHGGANRAGDGHDITYSPITRHGVVLVSLQYRLGTFGFLSLPALSAETGTSGNYALLDQIAALKWVRDNIASFGGDPGNVTIFGESAGSQDVGLLMLSPLARGLFNKAIEESGTAGFGLPPRSLAENERLGLDFAAKMGASGDAGGLKALRAASPEAILAATDRLIPPNIDPDYIWLQAIVDGVVLPKAPAEILSHGEQANVPLLIGTNARELTLGGIKAAPHGWLTQNLPGRAPELWALYQQEPAVDPVLGDVADRLSTDFMMRCPSQWVANRQSALTPKVWLYQVSIPAPDTVKPVEHAGELKYVFQKTPLGALPSDWPPLQLYWTNFAKTGDPNGPGLPAWPSLGTNARYIDFTDKGAVAGSAQRGPFCKIFSGP